MSQDAGDKSRETGLSDTFENSTDSEIKAGAFVGIVGDNQIAPADSNGDGGDALVGVVQSDIPAGESGTVHLSGALWGRIGSSVSAGNELGAVDSSVADSESPGVAIAGSDDVHVLETQNDTNGVYIGRVVLE